MVELKSASGVSYRAQCQSCAVAYSSLMRWKGRRLRGASTAARPGPAKPPGLDLASLERQIQALAHGRHRSAGVGALYRRYQAMISRRDLELMVARIREESKRQQRLQTRRITWHRPGLVWSMDDLEFEGSQDGDKVYVHAVEDLGSSYKLPPLVGPRLACGDAVARHQDGLFRSYGAPLFLKRDNHGNLNDMDVDGVLERALVLPLNSPPHYPPYNGGMERAQRELKEEVQRQRELAGGASVEQWIAAAVERINHHPRPCLQKQTSCAMLSLGCQEAENYTRFKRKEICVWIKSVAAQVVTQGEGAPAVSAAQAWRVAVEDWLVRNGVISIAQG